MQEVVVRSWDDLHATEDGSRVEADHRARLVLDDREVELDLTDDHYAELDTLLRRWFKAGETARATAAPKGDLVGARAYRKRMRSFANAHDFSYQAKKNGSFYYSKELRAAFDAWEREHGEWKVSG